MQRPPRRAVLLLLLLLASGSAACRSTVREARVRPYVLAFLVRGPSAAGKTPEERSAIQTAHLANIDRLAGEGKIVSAGPFGHPVPDPALRGIFVFDTGDLAQAKEWTSTDPAVREGVLGMELAAFETAAPLRRALEKDLAEERARAARGESHDHAGSIREYTMVLARDATKAEAALAELRGQGKVLFECPLAGSSRGAYAAVIDAAGAEAAATMLGARRAEIGEHDLASWWASRSLESLGRLGG
jgi:uncharacterized protein YciI